MPPGSGVRACQQQLLRKEQRKPGQKNSPHREARAPSSKLRMQSLSSIPELAREGESDQISCFTFPRASPLPSTILSYIWRWTHTCYGWTDKHLKRVRTPPSVSDLRRTLGQVGQRRRREHNTVHMCRHEPALMARVGGARPGWLRHGTPVWARRLGAPKLSRWGRGSPLAA